MLDYPSQVLLLDKTFETRRNTAVASALEHHTLVLAWKFEGSRFLQLRLKRVFIVMVKVLHTVRV